MKKIIVVAMCFVFASIPAFANDAELRKMQRDTEMINNQLRQLQMMEQLQQLKDARIRRRLEAEAEVRRMQQLYSQQQIESQLQPQQQSVGNQRFLAALKEARAKYASGKLTRNQRAGIAPLDSYKMFYISTSNPETFIHQPSVQQKIRKLRVMEGDLPDANTLPDGISIEEYWFCRLNYKIALVLS